MFQILYMHRTITKINKTNLYITSRNVFMPLCDIFLLLLPDTLTPGYHSSFLFFLALYLYILNMIYLYQIYDLQVFPMDSCLTFSIFLMVSFEDLFS